jgi:hypothetical protein
MRTDRHLRRMLSILATLFVFASQSASAKNTTYTFISGQEVFDALSQESWIVQGYLLGVTDALKHNENHKQCFEIPLRPDADKVIVSAFLDFWASAELPNSGVEAITTMMKARFPCSSKVENN